jgi:hypothetical protein
MAGAVSRGWTLRADVPDGTFALAIEADLVLRALAGRERGISSPAL